MDRFSCKQSFHTLSLGANGFTFLTTSHLVLKLMFLFFNFQTGSLSVVEVLSCSNLKDDLCKLNLVLNSFSVCPIYVSWLFEVVSVTVALYTRHLVRHLPSSGQEFFFTQPCNVNVATNVAKTLLTLFDKRFLKNLRLSKIFNRNTRKVSYICLPNVKQSPIASTAYYNCTE